MPFGAIRDQTELTLIDKSRATWARASDLLYSPAGEIRTLKAGETVVKIGGSGYDEWLKAGDTMILSFVKPERGRVIVFGPDRAPKYDSAVDTGDVYVTKGSFVECLGFAQDVFTVRGKTLEGMQY